MSSGRQIGYAQIGLGIVAALAGFGVAALLLPPRRAPAGQAADHRLGGPHPDAPMPGAAASCAVHAPAFSPTCRVHLQRLRAADESVGLGGPK